MRRLASLPYLTLTLAFLSGCHLHQGGNMAPRYEICVGLNKGHKTTKIKQLQYRGDRKVKGIRPSRTKG
ncbi:hypothetical protein pipiens_001990, partial [Culex pipiens pipiens]